MNTSTVVGSYLKQIFKFPPICSVSIPYSTSIDVQDIISLLQASPNISQVSQIHGRVIKAGLDTDTFILSKLVASSIQDVNYATSIFSSVQNPNLFMFNTMLRCYSINDDPKRAFLLFNSLRATGISLDQFSFISTLKSCARVSTIEVGVAIHGVVIRSGFDGFINLRNTLLHLYCACGSINCARQLFDESLKNRDSVSWNTLIGGYLRVSQPDTAFNLFRVMCREGLRCDVATMSNVLSAVGDLGDHFGGQLIHGYCIKIGICSVLNVVTALISMYGKTGRINSGRRVFDENVEKDVILWNCLIDGYARGGQLEESLTLLRLMKIEGLRPNSSTLAGLLSACAASEAGVVGRSIGNYVGEEGLELDSILGTSLLDMYSKCGFLEDAVQVFNSMERKDVQSWTAMISAYGAHGQAETAAILFRQMEDEGLRPNEVTFLAVLTACSHRGLVQEGLNFFEKMVQAYGIIPHIEHYGCVIDLMGRAGLLREAYETIMKLPIERDATMWRALLAACRLYGNVQLGEHVRRVLAEGYDEHPSDSILLSSTYAGRMEEDKRAREMEEPEYKLLGIQIERKVKVAGYSSIEMAGEG